MRVPTPASRSRPERADDAAGSRQPKCRSALSPLSRWKRARDGRSPTLGIRQSGRGNGQTILCGVWRSGAGALSPVRLEKMSREVICDLAAGTSAACVVPDLLGAGLTW